ncbi:hypothetical protein IAR55_004906 [Kwoniella newhampshirensis]|uniref:Telomerase reverse transcriptase n=1 Tax=Kwoniella newhampshirensis TaxID=1651941 RepID=A0AAW0YJH7_9TREE
MMSATCSSASASDLQPILHATEAQKTQRKIRHKTLSAYYGSIQTLHSYILCETGGQSPLQQDDIELYRHLIDSTLCAFRNEDDASKARIRPGAGGEKHGEGSRSQQEAIDRILRELGRQSIKEGDGGKNVLVSGSRYPAVDLPINPNRPQVENRHVHSPSSVLRSLPWRILRTRIGDEGFRQILLNASLFLPVGNNCYMQLSGRPIYDLYDHDKMATKVPLSGSTEGRKRKDKGKGPCGRCKRKRRKADDEEGENDNTVKAKSPRVGPAGINIARQKMFYGQPYRLSNGCISSGLPPHHILYKLKPSSYSLPTDRTCLTLLQSIFPSLFVKPTSRDNERFTIKGSPRRIEGMLGMAREILVRHSRIDYQGVLRRSIEVLDEDIKYPLPARLPMTIEGEGFSQPTTQALPDSACTASGVIVAQNEKATLPSPPGLEPVSHRKVSRYVKTIFAQVLSPVIMGSQRNVTVLKAHARRFVQVKQYEPVSLHSLLDGIAISDFDWLGYGGDQRATQSEMTMRRQLVEDFVKWLFDDFLVPLLKNTFYITETAATRYETVYYSQEEWAQATKPHFEQLQQNLLKELDKNQSFFALQGPLGVSAVRLIPKPAGFRPIVNLGRKIKRPNILGISTVGIKQKEMTANQILRGVHQVLTFEKDRHRNKLGGSLFGTNEIFDPIQELKTDLIQKHGKLPRLFFVKMDIKAAFDTIKQDKMLEIVSRLLDKNHDYCLMMYCLLLPPASKASQGSARRLYKTRAIVDNHISASFGDHAEEIAAPLRNAVIVDLVRRRQVTREACMDLLRTHIKNNVWQVGKKYFRQKTGIPQGSKISSLLCSIFYAYMENEFLAWTRRDGSRLLRYIDDFLYITDDHSTARRFVEVMSRGFPEYGAEVSKGKTLLSFEFDTGSQMVPVCGISDDGQSYFPYCGFLINMRTLEIMPDYPRVISTPMKQSFALRSNRHRGSGFVGWFSRQLENRNHMAYLDTAHNDIHTVHFNIFLNFALTTMKVPHYFRAGDLSSCHDQMVYDALCASAEYTYIAGRARVKHASRHDAGRDHYGVRKSDFLFLAKTAMSRVLRKKARLFKGVIDLLEQGLRGRLHTEAADRLASVIEKGWDAVKGANY